ncbi:hypothetical protein K488DRAFT_89173 [Vararia minispora EC-137]|uniref:Uncharacterized protein n=1 Tax=Vararia minispora EC-137 TaxID=1314806 RepID=A0ACB8QBE2_9AGAM|nr:hypothetical protein K488DRAFT_89173 [Vararia minispora EC-137]
MSLYTPIFLSDKVPRRTPSQSSSGSELPGGSRQHQVSLSDRLRDQHLALANVPAIQSPPSPNLLSPDAQAKRMLQKHLREAVDAAQGQPSNGRWSHVHALVRLSSSDTYWDRICMDIGEDPDDDMECFLAETEEEFTEWQARQEARRREKRRRREKMTQRELEEHLVQPPDPKAQAEAYAKITKWQNDFVPTSQPADVVPQGLMPHGSGSSPLDLPILEQGADTGASKKGKERAKTPITIPRHFPAPAKEPEHHQVTVLAPEQQDDAPVMSTSPDETAAVSAAAARGELRISQISEAFIPPSFKNVVTSTPPPEKPPPKTKPPVIPIASGLLTLPQREPTPFAPSQVVQPEPEPESSRRPRRSPHEDKLPEDSFDAYVYAPDNEAKRSPQAPAHLPVPVLSPLRTSIPPLSQCSTASTPPGLGHTHGLPPQTPESGHVLATSRRSQRRPRPPSRKQSVSAPSTVGDDDGVAHAPSPPRGSFFSSPASGSSSGSQPPVPQSPLSPLYPRDKAPAGSQFDLDFNSQTDVEARVERVSMILENEVDFDQWLRQSAVPE